MTAIVAYRTAECGFMGGDRNRTIDGFSFPAQPKVWKKEDASGNVWLFGVSGSADLQRVAQYCTALPLFVESEDDLETEEGVCEYVNKKYVGNLLQALDDAHALTRNCNGSANLGGNILIIFRGRIFRVIGIAATLARADETYVTTGTGSDASLSWLYAVEKYAPHLPIEEKIRSAIDAAGLIYSSIGGGIDVIST